MINYHIQELIDFKRYYTALHTYSDNRLHTHSFWEILYQIRGESKNTVNGKTFTLKTGEAIIMRPGTSHKIVFNGTACTRDIYVTDEKMQKISSAFENGFYERLLNGSDDPFPLDACTIADLEENLLVFSLSGQITKELDDLHTSTIAYILGYFVKNQFYANGPLPSWLKTLVQNLSTDEFLSQTVSEIVQTTNYSYAHVAREFKKHIGIPLKTYITQVKLERAAIFLTSTNDSVFSIAQKFSYTSLNGFISAFTEFYKLSPSKYRKQYTQKKEINATPPPDENDPPKP